MKLRLILFVLLVLSISACGEKETPIDALVGVFTSNVQEATDQFVIEKKDSKWFVLSNKSEQIVELFPIEDKLLNLLKDSVTASNKFECIGAQEIYFCTVDENIKTKKDDMVFASGYFLAIVDQNSNIIMGYAELVKQ